MNFLQDTVNSLMKPMKFLSNFASDLMAGEPVYYERKPEEVKPVVKPAQKDTPNKLESADRELIKNVLYGEISDRDGDKQSLEANTILSTAINRIGQYAEKGKEMSLAEVFQQPNQYQAYAPDNADSLYSKSKRGEYATGGDRRLKAIEDTLQQYESGNLKDNTNGAVFYIHNDDGTIEYDDTRKLYK